MEKKSLPHHDHTAPQLFNLLRNVTHNLKGQPGDVWPAHGLPWIEYEDWFIHPNTDGGGDEEPFSWLASSIQSIGSYSPPKRAQDHLQSGQDQSKEKRQDDKEENATRNSNDIPIATLSIEDDFELVFDTQRPEDICQPSSTNVTPKLISRPNASIPETPNDVSRESDESPKGSGLFCKLGMNPFIDYD